jgi:hypothetical protein
MRHASFILVGTRTLPRLGFSAPASIHLATQTPFIAGPLGVTVKPLNLDRLLNNNFNIPTKIKTSANEIQTVNPPAYN